MKKNKFLKLISILFVALITIAFIPIKALAVSVSPGSITIPVGGSQSFSIYGNGAAGLFSMWTEGPVVASINGGAAWIDYDGATTITVTGTSAGSGTVNIYLDDVTTKDYVDLSGQSFSVYVNVYQPQENPGAGTGGEEVYWTPGEGSDDTSLSKFEVEGYTLKDEGHDIFSCTVPKSVKKIKVIAEANDKNAKVTGAGEISLKEGLNEIDVIVEAENGTKRSYRLNITCADKVYNLTELKTEISKIKEETITVKLEDGDELSKELLDAIKKANKTIVLEKYDGEKFLYSWTIIGKNIKNMTSFNPSVTFESKDKEKTNLLTNYAQGINLNFAHKGELPKGTKFLVNVDGKYNDKAELNLYYYDEENEEMVLEASQIKVKNNNVKLEITHCSEYFLTQATLITQSSKISKTALFIILGEALVIIGLVIALIILLLKKNKTKPIKTNEDITNGTTTNESTTE